MKDPGADGDPLIARNPQAHQCSVDVTAVPGHDDGFLSQVAALVVADRARAADFHGKAILIHVGAEDWEACFNAQDFADVRAGDWDACRGQPLQHRFGAGTEQIKARKSELIVSPDKSGFATG